MSCTNGCDAYDFLDVILGGVWGRKKTKKNNLKTRLWGWRCVHSAIGYATRNPECSSALFEKGGERTKNITLTIYQLTAPTKFTSIRRVLKRDLIFVKWRCNVISAMPVHVCSKRLEVKVWKISSFDPVGLQPVSAPRRGTPSLAEGVCASSQSIGLIQCLTKHRSVHRSTWQRTWRCLAHARHVLCACFSSSMVKPRGGA